MKIKKIESNLCTAPSAEEVGLLTMSQIATELGLSRVTVSSVVNGLARERRVAPATERRIREYLARRGYVPNRHALRMRDTEQAVTGLLIVGGLYSHLHDALNRFYEIAADRPQGMEVVSCRQEDVVAGLEELLGRGAIRLLWINAHAPILDERGFARAEALLARFTHVAVYNYEYDRQTESLWRAPRMMRIGIDRARSMRELCRHLHALGHRRAVLAVAYADPQIRRRYESLFREEGLAFHEVHPQDERTGALPIPERSPLLAPAVVKAVKTLDATAVCFLDDLDAAYGLRALLDAGISVPQDVSVSGFDGAHYTAALRPALTTLQMPTESMVRHALTALVNEPAECDYILPMQLLLRESTGPARNM